MKKGIQKLILVGGGTGGHLTPLVALAQEVRTKYPNCQLIYIGATGDKLGGDLTASKGLFSKRYFIFAGKWHRFSNDSLISILYFWRADFYKNILNFFLFLLGLIQSLIILIKDRPQLVFSKGGYVAVPPCFITKLLKIPLVTHDSDAVLGLAHLRFRNYASLQLIGLKPSQKIKRGKSEIRSVGIPVNSAFAKTLSSAQKREVLAKYGLPAEAKVILVTGGGAGARSLNLGVLEAIDNLELSDQIHFIIATGAKYHQEAVDKAADINNLKHVRIFDFIDDMPDLMRASFAIITRAGATILTEISLAKKPTIIVPNPLLPGRHQIHNAHIFKDVAWLVKDTGQKINQNSLKKALLELFHNPSKRLKYQRGIGNMANVSATENTLQALEEVISHE